MSVLLLMLAVTSITGCAPRADVSPTPTPAFASEEEAFAAAEAVYRSYIDAFNAVDLQNPETFEPLAEFTAGDYESSERESLSKMHAEGNLRGGAIRVVWFRASIFVEDESVVARTCDDVSATTFTDSDGRSLIPSDRPATYALDLEFRFEKRRLVLVSAEPVEDPTCII